MAAASDQTSGQKEPKRAHKSLSIEQKVEILDKIGKKSYKLLSEEY
jgi:hypothetical protein